MSKREHYCVSTLCYVLLTDPHFSEWSDWSNCTRGCQSYKYRTRRCENSDLGACEGEPVEYRMCERASKIACFDQNLPQTNDSQHQVFLAATGRRMRRANLAMEEEAAVTTTTVAASVNTTETAIPTKRIERWSNWSECSAKCGLGQQVRHVVCFGIDWVTECDANKKEFRDCMVRMCHDGVWSEWSEWSNCYRLPASLAVDAPIGEDTICNGNGSENMRRYVRTRSRRCLNDTCMGESTQSQVCSEPSNGSVDKAQYCSSKALPLSTIFQTNP